MSLNRFKKNIKSFRKDDYVSVWLGNFDSETELNNYLEESYNGDTISKFADQYKLNYYDHDFLEMKFLIDKRNIRELLEPLSYSKNFIEYVIKDSLSSNLKQVNTAILLYNFQYDMEVPIKNSELSFINHYKYR